MYGLSSGNMCVWIGMGLFKEMYQFVFLDDKKEFIFSGNTLANGMKVLKLKDFSGKSYPGFAYTKNHEDKDHPRLVIKGSCYHIQMYAWLWSMRHWGILHDKSEGVLKNAWDWLNAVEYGKKVLTCVSHLTGSKFDLMPLNYCIEFNVENARREINKCLSRCKCYCKQFPKCLMPCNNKDCYGCTFEKREDKSVGYPGVKEYLDLYRSLSEEQMKGDLFMQFLRKIKLE
jgi:hypothetical protein